MFRLSPGAEAPKDWRTAERRNQRREVMATHSDTGCFCSINALGPLISGYRRFRETEWIEEQERFRLAAANGQRPHSLVIACSDSRVDPQMIFGARPGELFVIRNVASLVPPYELDQAHHGTSAAIEFAVRLLEVERVIVLGHEACGGIGMLLDEPSASQLDFATRWMALARAAASGPIATGTAEQKRRACEEAVVRLSLDNLLTFPWIAAAVDQKRLSLHGGYFDIGQGRLLVMGEDGEFAPVAL